MTQWKWSYDDISTADYERLMEIIASRGTVKQEKAVPLHKVVQKRRGD